MSRLNIKTLGAMRMSRIIVPHMQQVGGGRIICIGGSSVRRPSPDSLVAGISNAALSNFTKHLSDIVASDGILVNVVHPSTTITSTWQSLIGNRAQNMSVSETEAISTLAATFPIGRIPDADDVAPLIVFLASDLARAITGQSIVVDGGKVRSVAY
jgi:3-oxoacyl-[acyl-carrier protein] reductase